MQFNIVETPAFIGMGFSTYGARYHARLWKIVFLYKDDGKWEPAVQKRWDHSRPLSARGWEIHQVLTDAADTNFDNALVKTSEWLVEQGILEQEQQEAA